MSVRGFCKARNESHILGESLDNWQQYCTDGIHIFDDCSDDATAEIARAHPAVVEVISTNLFDPDRERSEWFNRQLLLASVQRFVGQDTWIVYFDADEHLFDFDVELLKDRTVECYACRSFDAY